MQITIKVTDKMIMQIIDQLDVYARDCSQFEYGLPMMIGYQDEMKQIIKRILVQGV